MQKGVGGMLGLLAVQIIIILLFLILGWAVRKKEGYWLTRLWFEQVRESAELTQ